MWLKQWRYQQHYRPRGCIYLEWTVNVAEVVTVPTALSPARLYLLTVDSQCGWSGDGTNSIIRCTAVFTYSGQSMRLKWWRYQQHYRLHSCNYLQWTVNVAEVVTVPAALLAAQLCLLTVDSQCGWSGDGTNNIIGCTAVVTYSGQSMWLKRWQFQQHYQLHSCIRLHPQGWQPPHEDFDPQVYELCPEAYFHHRQSFSRGHRGLGHLPHGTGTPHYLPQVWPHLGVLVSGTASL